MHSLPLLSPSRTQAIKARVHQNKPARKAAFKNFQEATKKRAERAERQRPILTLFTDIDWNPVAPSRLESPALSPFSNGKHIPMPTTPSPTEPPSADTPTKDVLPGSKLIVRQATQGIQHIMPQAFVKSVAQPASRPLEQILLMARKYEADMDVRRGHAIEKLQQQILDARSPRGSYSRLWKPKC